MTRVLRLAGAQMGANQKADSREAILARMVALLEQAAAAGAKMVVFPELPLTTFFRNYDDADALSPDLPGLQADEVESFTLRGGASWAPVLADKIEEGEGRLEGRGVGAVFGGGQLEGLGVEFGEEGRESSDTFGLPSGIGPELDVHVVDIVVILLVGVIAKALHDLQEAFLGAAVVL